MILKRHTEFKINNKLCYSENSIDTDYEGYLVIDFSTITKYPNIDALPVRQLVCKTLEEKYLIENSFVIIGGIKDICLI